ncbi:hypothetical protein [Streptomyces mirabilis]|uniref:hypothetical protein n=2 Tax=Streptomyces mirabilis TaxID=68239 RepID=UPI0036DE64C3
MTFEWAHSKPDPRTEAMAEAARAEAAGNLDEAVDILRRLAAIEPEGHEPDLAVALTNLGSQLSHVGRRNDAVAPAREASEIFRQLTALNPFAFAPNLVSTLHNLSVHLAQAGQHGAARAAAAEAAAVREWIRLGFPRGF